MTQRDRVLHALQAAGERGVTQVDFMLPGVIDGGAPITRVAARIDELRRAGHQIVNAEWRQKCIVYRLEQPAAATASEPAQDASGALSLFTSEPASASAIGA
jgi:hypothetical protein